MLLTIFLKISVDCELGLVFIYLYFFFLLFRSQVGLPETSRVGVPEVHYPALGHVSSSSVVCGIKLISFWSFSM